MKKTTILSLFLSVIALCGLSAAQTALTQTTLAAAQSCGPGCSLPSGLGATSYQTTVSLTSATGVTQAFNGQPVTFFLVDLEVEGIQTLVTGQTTIYNVLRGQMGTKTMAHASGSMVLIQNVTPQFGGFAGSGGLQSTDPPLGGACTTANTLVTPWVNVITGYQWLCSTITQTWVPGFNNPLQKANTAAVASAAGQITPSGPQFHITGALAITGFLVPIGCNATTVGGCEFTVIPDAAFTTTATNNIATAVTAVANLPITWRWDATNSKFVSLQSK